VTRPGSGRGARPAAGPRPQRSAVSATSADRFAARSRARRWEGLRPLATLLVLLALAAAAAWVGYASPFFAVRTVEVTGVRALTPQAVLDAARVEAGKPLLRLDSDAVRARVAALPRVSSAEVRRQWPHGVRIAVTERQTVAVLRIGSRFQLVDRTGVPFETVARQPRGVPLIVAGQPPPAASLRAAAGVIAALPPGISRRVTTVRPDSPDSVVLHLAGGITVMWGSAEDSGRKAVVLVALMKHRAKVYDVSAPDAPTTRGTP
jgi:cell division protein FtsQ